MNNCNIQHRINKLIRSCRCIIILIVLCITMMLIFRWHPREILMRLQNIRMVNFQMNTNLSCVENEKTSGRICQWYFLNYTPSSWERTWFDNIEEYQNDACERLYNSENLNRTILAVNRLIELQRFGRNRTTSENKVADHLLSSMFYRQECIDLRTNHLFTVAEISHLIEPLVGLLRDPMTICPRINSPLFFSSLYDGAIVQSKRFLLLSILAPMYINNSLKANSQNTLNFDIIDNNMENDIILPWMYQRLKLNLLDRNVDTDKNKNILLDLGSSYFGHWGGDSSAAAGRWFYNHYKSHGMKFDRIIAFEYSPLNPKSAWGQLPNDVVPIYTLINVGCAKSGKFNPWTTLQAVAKQQDHVVVKMDIDSSDIENALINQVLNDTKISSLIDELFFEHHITVKPMIPYWGRPSGTLKDSYILFTKLRQLGIRMHSWP